MDWRRGEYSPALVVSAATTHIIFGPIELQARSACVLGGHLVTSGIEPMPYGLESDAVTTWLPTGPTNFNNLHSTISHYI
ncbi:hypothetical protein TNCV_2396491 [Trichonephila clavipes]|uniref:Uncharacterized protein n=1 Tax=Trichonephila clavipes TaxID=2585209 RepID=A0A8X6SW04_TRICX|nr:hypothetical protein TNCV_2396491 [Trichonephila clavipes]